MNEELFAKQQKERKAFEKQLAHATVKCVDNALMIKMLFDDYGMEMPPVWKERIESDIAAFHAEWGANGWRQLEMQTRHEFQLAHTFKRTGPSPIPPFLLLYYTACDEKGKALIKELSAAYYEARYVAIEQTLNELTIVHRYIDSLINKRQVVRFPDLLETIANNFTVEAQLIAAFNPETPND